MAKKIRLLALGVASLRQHSIGESGSKAFSQASINERQTMSTIEEFWTWVTDARSRSNFRKLTVPDRITELPCGCKREIPVRYPRGSRSSIEEKHESRWQVRCNRDGNLTHLQCKKQLTGVIHYERQRP